MPLTLVFPERHYWSEYMESGLWPMDITINHEYLDMFFFCKRNYLLIDILNNMCRALIGSQVRRKKVLLVHSLAYIWMTAWSWLLYKDFQVCSWKFSTAYSATYSATYSTAYCLSGHWINKNSDFICSSCSTYTLPCVQSRNQ